MFDILDFAVLHTSLLTIIYIHTHVHIDRHILEFNQFLTIYSHMNERFF